MVSSAVKEVTEQDRRKLLAVFLYDMAKLMFGSVAVGGLSPLFMGGELGIINVVCIVFGSMVGILLASCVNNMLKLQVDKQNGSIFVFSYFSVFVSSFICHFPQHESR